jgi:hypothetical protein
MADLAMVFHWAPATMRDMEIEELMEWHRLARDRMRDLMGQ